MIASMRVLGLYFLCIALAIALPAHFVYLSDVAPSILQDMRYASYHNFIGRPVSGYKNKTCILTQAAAYALVHVQQQLLRSSLSLKVYDCYRPTDAVADFITWSLDRKRQEMKPEFYPAIDKKDVFRLGYVAAHSGHSRGSTLDLTIVALPAASSAPYFRGEQLVSCTAPYTARFRDNSIDMGSGFDCMDPVSHIDNLTISKTAKANRSLLRKVMMQNGFVPYQNEWWHFSLRHEPYPHHYFNFMVL